MSFYRPRVGISSCLLGETVRWDAGHKRDAYLVKCDSETTTQDDINRGVVNVLVGFAPLKPAEFVIISIQQMAGQIAT